MKSIRILIAGAVVILAVNMLVGCSTENNNEKENNKVSAIGAQRIAAAQEMRKVVSLTAEAMEDGDEILIKLMLSNPEKKPLTSVQAWLTYNPDVLEGISIDTANSAFELMAPYSNDFDPNAGLMMLGRSSAQPVSDEEIVIANIRFERTGNGAAMIEAYDYRHDLEGHTSANIMIDGAPVNVLLKPQTALVTVNQ